MSNFLKEYSHKHQHPLNRLMHRIGIPLILISLPMLFWNIWWALALFIIGWIFQFIGHFIEGNQPAFFKNPLFLIVGALWYIKGLFSSLGLSKESRR